jgi:transposase
MRPYGTPKQLERRRQKALALLNDGWSLEEVAARVNADFSSVYRWREKSRRGGANALRAKPASGRPRKIRAAQGRRFLEILLKGALAYGFSNEMWTLGRMARVIRKEFGIRYHPCHVWKVLQRMEWSCQVPERRAIQQDDVAIAHWKRYKWPHIKKRRKTWGPHRLS